MTESQFEKRDFLLHVFLEKKVEKPEMCGRGANDVAWVDVETVLIDSAVSTSIKSRPGRSGIRARSVTFVTLVAEYSMAYRFSVVL